MNPVSELAVEAGNKLIARFEQPLFAIEIPDYHKSWNDLMPVIEKIGKINIEQFEDTDMPTELFICSLFTDIKSAWMYVVDFIQWYNKINKP